MGTRSILELLVGTVAGFVVGRVAGHFATATATGATGRVAGAVDADVVAREALVRTSSTAAFASSESLATSSSRRSRRCRSAGVRGGDRSRIHPMRPREFACRPLMRITRKKYSSALSAAQG